MGTSDRIRMHCPASHWVSHWLSCWIHMAAPEYGRIVTAVDSQTDDRTCINVFDPISLCAICGLWVAVHIYFAASAFVILRARRLIDVPSATSQPSEMRTGPHGSITPGVASGSVSASSRFEPSLIGNHMIRKLPELGRVDPRLSLQ